MTTTGTIGAFGPAASGRQEDTAVEVRREVARELHDSVAHSLTLLVVELELLKLHEDRETVLGRVAALQEITRSALADLRRVLYSLRSDDVPDRLDLLAMIDREARDFEARTGVRVSLLSPDAGFDSVPSGTALNVFRVVEAALANVWLHSRARHVQVVISPSPSAVMLTIEDDGGAPANGIRHEGLGILGMRERLLLIGGELELLAEPTGVRIVATIPRSALA